jgi:Ca2+-binding EF-hand superfamily protein
MTRLTKMLALTGAVLGFATAASAQDAEAKAKAMFEKADANHDGAISAEEWQAAGRRERGFQMIDADHDGKITPDELRAAAAKRGQ